ncbi:MAG: OmpA family protein [Rhodospirillales bacterium]|nr:OmpA family protein [Rhodospirillales bacterium]
MAAATPAAEPPPAPPAGAAALPGKATQIVFESSVSKLPENSKQVLKGLVDNVIDDANLRLQLLAYAGGESLSSSKARRLSLSRALSVRSFLIENGLRSTRIDVRALGNKTTQDPVNRVDINVVER